MVCRQHYPSEDHRIAVSIHGQVALPKEYIKQCLITSILLESKTSTFIDLKERQMASAMMLSITLYLFISGSFQS